jgi:transposase
MFMSAEVADLKAQVRKLEKIIARLTAENGQMRELIHRQNCAQDLAQIQIREKDRELTQERLNSAALREQLDSMINAVQHMDERFKAMVRREFGASSERLLAGDGYIPEVLDHFKQLADISQTSDLTVNGQDDAPESSAPEGRGRSKDEKNAKRKRRPANAGGRNPLPEDWERRESQYTPPTDHPDLKNVTSYDIIGTRVVQRMHADKPSLFIQVLTCPTVRMVLPNGTTIQQTLTPPTVIWRGQVSDRVVISSAVDKVADHLPCYRQEQRLVRLDTTVHRSKLCRWHIALAQFLAGIAQCIFDEIVSQPVIGIDDSVHRLQVPDRAVCLNGRIWAISTDDEIFYFFTTSRESEWIANRLKCYRGVVMGDAYSGHNQLLSRDDIIAIFCWAHVRRKFFEAADSARKKIMLDMISELYEAESDTANMAPEERRFARNARAKPVLERIKKTLDAWHQDPSVLPKSGIGIAVRYALKLWDGLIYYCDMGEAPIDNNQTERGMRRVAMHRKNSLFSASTKGAEAYATLLTIIQTAMLHKLDPVQYLEDVVEDIHHNRRSLAELTPAAYARRLQAGVKSRP